MKKIFFAISMLAVAFGFTACSNEDDAVSNAKKGKATVVAFTELGATRTALRGDDTEGYQVVWSKGDQITIDTEKFTIDDEFADNTTAKFTGNVLNKGEYTALYGIDEMVWPDVQTYKEGNVANFPMYASATVDSEGNISPLSFKNFGGLLRLTVKGDKVIVKGDKVIKKIEIESGDQMTGTIGKSRIGNTFTLVKSSSGKVITLDCGDGVKLTESGTDFYIALFEKNYRQVKIRLIATDGTMCLKTLNPEYSLQIIRSQITKASFTAKSFDNKAITKDSPEGFIGMIANNEGIVVKLGDKKVVIATKNYGATTIDEGAGSENINDASCYGIFKNNQDASSLSEVALGGTGWRLPTVEELEALKEKVVWNEDRHGVEWKVTDKSTLYMPAAGGYAIDRLTFQPNYIEVGTAGYYWSSADNKNIFAFYHDKDKDNKFVAIVNPYNPDTQRYCYYYIRPFHDMPTE
ncbi:MAG: hypothetical protein KBS99_02660 [Prevotellaceae bacterium]|nr:hypothetical protein [Candidatus Colivivens caballi]